MPGIDFQQLQAEISVAEVLELLGFIATNGSGDQRYGPCPLNSTTAKQRDRRFSVDLRSGRFSTMRPSTFATDCTGSFLGFSTDNSEQRATSEKQQEKRPRYFVEWLTKSHPSDACQCTAEGPK